MGKIIENAMNRFFTVVWQGQHSQGLVIGNMQYSTTNGMYLSKKFTIDDISNRNPIVAKSSILFLNIIEMSEEDFIQWEESETND